MSSESETEEHVMGSGSEEEQESEVESENEGEDSTLEEEQSSGSESEEVESEIESEQEEDSTEELKEDAAESDSENDEVDSDDDIPVKEKSKSHKKEEKIPFDQPKSDWRTKMITKYEQLKGKSLFVRFPHVLPDLETLEKTAKELCNRIIRVRRPRQKRPRHCLIDFDSPEDRIKAMKELKKVEIKGQKLVISIPRTDNEEFIEKMIEKKSKKIAAQRARAKLRKAAKKNNETGAPGTGKTGKTYTSTITVQNIPSESTLSDIKKLFPNAVDVKVNFAKGSENTTSATVTLPTPKEATIAKRRKYKIGENDLKTLFVITGKGKGINVKHKPDQANGKSAIESLNSKGGKRKPEEASSIESSSPKKKKRNVNKGSEKGTQAEPKVNEKNIKNFKKKNFNKKLDNIKGVNKADNKHTKPMTKQIKKKKTIEKIHNNPISQDTVTEKKKVKKEKPGKPFRFVKKYKAK